MEEVLQRGQKEELAHITKQFVNNLHNFHENQYFSNGNTLIVEETSAERSISTKRQEVFAALDELRKKNLCDRI